MPELPDVEALRRHLIAQGIVGHALTGVTLHWPRAVKAPSPEEFSRRIVGKRIQELTRRAKFLLFHLNRGVLAIHLRMTGSLELAPSSQQPHHLARTIFALDGGVNLQFIDGRKFGAMWLLEDATPLLARLGPEPLEESFTPQVMVELLRGRNAPIKPLLLEQELIAGVGNIYADEILFVPGIHPMRRASGLSTPEVEALHSATQRILADATEYLTRLMPIQGPPTESEEGLMALKVPRSEGAPCTKCGTPLQRMVIRQRSAYFCPRCQPDSR